MTIRQFAKFAGVSHSTVVRLMAEESDHTPDLDSLIKIAKATNIDVFSLIAMVKPNDTPDIDPEARILAQQIVTLSNTKRDMLATFLSGMGIELPKKKS